MSNNITTRVIPVIVLLSLLGTGVAQAFCFLKGHDRSASYNNSRMPAVGFTPAAYPGYSYGPVLPGWDSNPAVLPQQQPYDNYYGAGTVLRH
jgi:hypothetical protein